MNTILITGAAGGLGTVVTEAFLQSGWQVIATIHNPSDHNVLIHRFADFHQQLTVIAADLTDPEQVNKLFTNIESLNAVAHLVGGYRGGQPITTTQLSTVVQMWEVNVKTAFLTIQASFPYLQQSGGGAITVIGAKFVQRPAAGVAAYASAKAALTALALTVAEEGRPYGIRTNVILPSIIRTPANLEWAKEQEAEQWITPEEIAQTIVFLSSEAGKGINGAIIPMYGKLSA